MRRAILLGIALAVFAAVLRATPRIAASELLYDFGTVREGILVVRRFTLRNEGTSPLTFTRPPGVSCGCTTAPLPQMTLAPGESVELEVRFETTGYGGRRAIQYVYVYSDDPALPRLTLVLQGDVAPREPYEDTAYMLRYRYRLILDVRSREAFARGHLLGAVNVPLAELEQALAWLPQTTLYVCDEAGEAGLAAAEWLRQRGFWAVRALAGGLAGWVQELGPYLLVGEKPTAAPLMAPTAVPPASLAREYFLLLDFREPAAFAREHLVGALPVGPNGLDRLLPHLLPLAGLPVELQPFIYCVDEGEGVAQAAAQFLQALGLARAYAVVGGLPQWRIRYGDSFLVALRG
ncbi:MAG: rhodanese-like domain-containing protein [Candidatus Bipolaricaulaceae bacterium]